MANNQSYAGNGAYPDSYYAASRNIIRTPKVLEGAVTADVAVLGAGYSGLSTAIHLAEKGYKVVMVEGAGIGWGASGATAGRSSMASMPASTRSSAAMATRPAPSSAASCRKAARSSAASSRSTRSIAT